MSVYPKGKVYGISSYNMMIELFATRDRGICVLLGLAWPYGMLALGLLAYVLPNWRHLYLATSLPMLVTILYYWILPESVYWLAERGRDASVNEVLQAAYKMNRAPIEKRKYYSSCNKSQDATALPPHDKLSKYRRQIQLTKDYFVATFKRKTFMLVLLIASFFLSVIAFLYNGLTLAADAFSSDRIVNWVITSLLEVPCNILVGPIVDRFGRKNPCSFSFGCVSIVFLALAFIQNDSVLTVMNHTAKFVVASAYTVVWLYLPEIYPTSHRNLGMGISISLSKVASVFSTAISNELRHNRMAFSIGLAACSLLSLVVTQFLWEPLGQPLPETIDEMPKIKLRLPRCISTQTKHEHNRDETNI